MEALMGTEQTIVMNHKLSNDLLESSEITAAMHLAARREATTRTTHACGRTERQHLTGRPLLRIEETVKLAGVKVGMVPEVIDAVPVHPNGLSTDDDLTLSLIHI